MFNISPEILKHLEELAQLELPEGLEEKMLQDLNHILGTFQIISRVEVPPETTTAFSSPLREDEPKSFENASQLLGQSRLQDGLLKVKPVLEEED